MSELDQMAVKSVLDEVKELIDLGVSPDEASRTVREDRARLAQGGEVALEQLRYELAQKHIVMQKQIDEISSDLNTSEYDIWTEGGRSNQESKKFKNSLINYYQRRGWFSGGKIKCMVTDLACKKEYVIGSHIWKHCKQGRGMVKFGLAVTDCLSPRNGLLLMKDIEMEFDIKGVCFLYDVFKQKLILKVLNPILLPKIITNTALTFADVDGKILHHPTNHLPFRRILNWHARCSYKYAQEQGWSTVTADENVADYFELSETASIPETTW
ncbi:hypothetical protein B484DRAFT_446745 [Ochromonadaceae sp. CCMP2298]|nr:hypothetical protein B484DRAFT_446745 [Ochromonadaceae sp. CCMP2298]|mmetsp:Transcript_4107/g.9214  ORF Transcript_4107/g.9214 Transcript_4107/m.9214 type:complete len:270 (+) Transcript_4107:139-948(+)|eukprot:CAMPEP_0173222154 /NCGR_PEP_ID=MMETSP1142-20121109/3105_1 /TAXON_ID=483371 /ORGANISM="non described non described, Strain CCMP2298" /LENGTH=269 /DNA_ID=CAMNT_0014150237 /DNA_START=59 /DNA_END=868 /DNA_ORIENTATION=-